MTFSAFRNLLRVPFSRTTLISGFVSDGEARTPLTYSLLSSKRRAPKIHDQPKPASINKKSKRMPRGGRRNAGNQPPQHPSQGLTGLPPGLEQSARFQHHQFNDGLTGDPLMDFAPPGFSGQPLLYGAPPGNFCIFVVLIS